MIEITNLSNKVHKGENSESPRLSDKDSDEGYNRRTVIRDRKPMKLWLHQLLRQHRSPLIYERPTLNFQKNITAGTLTIESFFANRMMVASGKEITYLVQCLKMFLIYK